MAKDTQEALVELPPGVEEDDVQEALDLLSKTREKRAKAAEKRATMTEEEKMKSYSYARRANARKKILVRKATEAGITVTKEEIQEEMAS